MTKAEHENCSKRATALRRAYTILHSEAAVEDCREQITGGRFKSDSASYRSAAETVKYLEEKLRRYSEPIV